MSAKRSVAGTVIAWNMAFFAYFFIWVPVFVLVIYSFNSSAISVGWEDTTLKWYNWLFSSRQAIDAFKVSLIVSALTSIIAVPLGTITAYGLYKHSFRGKAFLRFLILLPILIPEVVLGGGLFLYFKTILHMQLGYLTMLIAHILYCVPLSTFIVLGRMQRIDWSLEEAAMDLGANWPVTMWKVIIPILMPGILGSILIVFPWSINNFIITYFVSGLGTTSLPVFVFGMMRTGINPGINALASLMIAGLLLFILLLSYLQKRMNVQGN
jgi:spermidine/putrescine transport system permease protein